MNECMQKNYTKVLELTLNALECFADDLTALLSAFSNMDSELEGLLERHKETNDMAMADGTVPLSEVKVSIPTS